MLIFEESIFYTNGQKDGILSFSFDAIEVAKRNLNLSVKNFHFRIFGIEKDGFGC